MVYLHRYHLLCKHQARGYIAALETCLRQLQEEASITAQISKCAKLLFSVRELYFIASQGGHKYLTVPLCVQHIASEARIESM